MIVREDDTVVCEDCYAEEAPSAIHLIAFASISVGTCELCGTSTNKEGISS